MKKPFLIIGGYGTVGSYLISLLNQFIPDLPIIIAGRNLEKARNTAALYNNTIGVVVDTHRADLGLDTALELSGIAVLTNDLSTFPAKYAISKGIPYTSIATQLNHFAPKLALYLNNPNGQLLIQDTSFAGVLISLGIYYSKYFLRVEQIRVASLMDENDLGGPASQADVDDFGIKEYGLLLENSQWIVPRNGKEVHEYIAEDGFHFTATSFPGFDAPELACATDASSVRVDFAFGESQGRRSGNQPSIEIIYELDGIFPDGEAGSLKFQLTHPKGQAYLTAVGVAVGIESLMLNNPHKGMYLPSQEIDPERMMSRLVQSGALLKSL